MPKLLIMLWMMINTLTVPKLFILVFTMLGTKAIDHGLGHAPVENAKALDHAMDQDQDIDSLTSLIMPPARTFFSD
jgi:hypothetical protein